MATRNRGRTSGITPRMTTEHHIVHIDPEHVEVGHLLHDGMVLGKEIRYNEETGKPDWYLFDTPHCLIVAEPGDTLSVYGRVVPEHAEKVREAYESGKAQV